MIEKITELVKKEAGEDDWKFHIAIVVKYAKHLAQSENVDEELAELAALLHDIGRLRFGPKDHEITGVVEAEKILKEFNYPEDVIEEVKYCVKVHRSDRNNIPKTKAAVIIRDADSLAHFDAVLYLIKVGLMKFDNNFGKAAVWVDEKIDRDWNKKIHLPESKKLGEEKYKAAKVLLKATKDCL